MTGAPSPGDAPLLAAASWIVELSQANAFSGFSVAGAGDVNKDGKGDLLIGAHGYDWGQADEGRVFVYEGTATGPSVSPSLTLEIDVAGAQFGYSVASAGDTNGDGYTDVVVGAPGTSSNQGAAYVFRGSPTGLVSTALWSKTGVAPGARLGGKCWRHQRRRLRGRGRGRAGLHQRPGG